MAKLQKAEKDKLVARFASVVDRVPACTACGGQRFADLGGLKTDSASRVHVFACAACGVAMIVEVA